MDSASENHIIEVLKRTLRTPKLLNVTKKQDTCPRYPVIADSTHIATECDTAYMSNKILLEFLNTHYPNSDLTPEITVLWIHFILTWIRIHPDPLIHIWV